MGQSPDCASGLLSLPLFSDLAVKDRRKASAEIYLLLRGFKLDLPMPFTERQPEPFLTDPFCAR